ncbi:MAG: hypothetical protein IJL88_05810, partial [Clostridia bacterium]|nr:hypothetical protein [Clostridia bacterium]
MYGREKNSGLSGLNIAQPSLYVNRLSHFFCLSDEMYVRCGSSFLLMLFLFRFFPFFTWCFLCNTQFSAN